MTRVVSGSAASSLPGYAGLTLALFLLALLSLASCPLVFAQIAKHQQRLTSSSANKNDWYGLLRQSEDQMAQGHFSQAANDYIKALKALKSLKSLQALEAEQSLKVAEPISGRAAERAALSAKVGCGDKRFIELMAVGDELAARGSRPVKPDSPAAVVAASKLTESAMKCREETAEAVCGAGSGAVIAAWQGLLLHYNMVQNRSLADVYQKKLLAPAVRAKFSEVEPYRTAGSARASAWLTTELKRSRSAR